MIRDVIDTFTNTTPAVNQKFVPKVALRKAPVTMPHTRTVDLPIMSF